MSDTPSTEAGSDTGTTAPTAQQFAPITSQDDLNKVIAQRIERERSKFADYGDLKAKAARLDEMEAANKTQAERLSEQADRARADADAARAELLRYRVAASHGITDADDIELFLTGTDEETLKRQAERLAKRSADASSPRSPKPDPNQGRTPSGNAATPADQFASFIQSQLGAR